MVTRIKDVPHGPNSLSEIPPQTLRSMNGDMGRRDYSGHKLTKPNPHLATSTASQATLGRSTTSPPTQAILNDAKRSSTNGDTMASDSSLDREDEVAQQSISDSSREKTAVNLKEIWASAPRPTLKAHYKLHNPLGPRWYKNHHLIPPSHLKPSMRPPTFFSSSFPPIGTATSSDYRDEGNDLSRSPSHSPLVTPESSQTRVQDGIKPRSRKTSQTAPDAIDLMDSTDPWGQNWHHQSPYEFGQTTTVASLDTYDLPKRTRHASFTTPRDRTVAPSPLSQSTSAINLNTPKQPDIKLPRKLSKRKTANVATIFQDQTPQVDRKTTSAPATPVDTLRLGSDAIPSSSDFLPQRMSVAPAGPYMSRPSPSSSTKKENRGSVLNRLVRKFSILKRSVENSPTGLENSQNEMQISRPEPRNSISGPENVLLHSEKTLDPFSSASIVKHLSGEEKSLHVPPSRRGDNASLSSLEIPYSVMGKLTIANPDPKDGNESRDVSQDVPLADLPEMTVKLGPSELPALPLSAPDLSLAPEPPAEKVNGPVEKPLPPRIATPRFSRLVLSDIVVSTPQMKEGTLPPVPPKDSDNDPPAPSREITPSPPIPESPADDDIFNVNTSISLDHVVHSLPLSRSPPPRKTHASPERVRSPVQKPSPIRETPHPMIELNPTQSPPTRTLMKRESPIRSLTRQQSSARNLPISPDMTTTSSKPQSRSSGSGGTGQPSYSSKERLDATKIAVDTKVHSNSRPETRQAPPSVHVPPPNSTTHLTPGTSSNNKTQQSAFTESPLSAVSVLANPPTPYDHRQSINGSDLSSVPPTLPPKSIRQPSPPPPTKTTGPASRQTETFRLVRSLSGNVYASSQTIVAQGQHWEIVESVDVKRRDKVSTKSRENVRRSRDYEKEREERGREKERQRARERERELERMEIEREREKEKERHRVKELESMEVERERAKEKERIERELAREREIERELERERVEMEIAREKELAKERERERQRERERRREKERERERIREKEREKRDREREREREKEREKRKERERREREKEKERERERRREKEREAERAKDRERDERRSRHYDQKSREYDGKSRNYYEWTDSSGHRSREDHDHRSRRGKHHQDYDDHTTSRRRDEYHKSTKHAPDPSSSSYYSYHPSEASIIVQPPSERPPAPRLERNLSTNTRPTSQLPSADEMNAIRAREKWEMERLWKARSLHGLEPDAVTTNFITGPGSTSSLSDDIPEIIDLPPEPAAYGSSHTAFVVQPPFHNRSQIYHSMPAVPPPIIYSSPRPLSIPSIPDSISSYEPYDHFRSYPGPPVTVSSSIPPLPPPKSHNPLPEPPRESSYKPAPLSSISPSKRRSTEYWTYNGITTAH